MGIIERHILGLVITKLSTMTDKDYIEYAKAAHAELYAMSTSMMDGIAAKVLTRLRKELPDILPLKEEWTSCPSNSIDVIDVLSILAFKGKPYNVMHKELETILEQYILDRFHALEPKQHLIVKYRYIGEFTLVPEVMQRIYERLKDHYNTQRMQTMLERYPDLKEV